MKILNVQLSRGVQQFLYEDTDFGIQFNNDVYTDNDWVVNKCVKHVMTNQNKQDNPNNYLEFIIHNNLDSSNKRVIRYYYYCKYDNKGHASNYVTMKNKPSGMYDNCFMLSGEYPISESVVFFLEHSLIFKCKDWNDFDDKSTK